MAEVERLRTWCKDNIFDLNVTKTMELINDFRKQPPAGSPITIDDDIGERREIQISWNYFRQKI